MPCHGNGADHCCYVEGEPCPHLLVDVVPGRRWACGLLVELGTWERVHADPRYLAVPAPVWRARGVPDCGDFRGSADGSILQCCFAEDA